MWILDCVLIFMPLNNAMSDRIRRNTGIDDAACGCNPSPLLYPTDCNPHSTLSRLNSSACSPRIASQHAGKAKRSVKREIHGVLVPVCRIAHAQCGATLFVRNFPRHTHHGNLFLALSRSKHCHNQWFFPHDLDRRALIPSPVKLLALEMVSDDPLSESQDCGQRLRPRKFRLDPCPTRVCGQVWH